MISKKDILLTADQLICGQRAQDYGTARENFERIATMWTVILKSEQITPAQVAMCMAALKLCRLVNTPDHADSWIDTAGYIALGGELATEEH
jgi:hypothetical protein|tara:strand:+ start:58 stop:333 length:276 start_codon:yes stop_codon:yes gene_type:complete